MIINKLEPQGYCKGVINAINIALNSEFNNQKTYALGALIHNKEMLKELSNRGIITIEDNGRTRLEMLDDISSGNVIISAHGACPMVYQKIKDKNLNLIDSTCGYVKMTHNEIKKHLELEYDVYYIGTKAHPECEGAIGISEKIKLISSLEDISKIDFKDNSFVINQTTLSTLDIKYLHDEILKKNPNVTIRKSICDATTKRQLAVINSKKVDLTIIVGDTTSSNSKKLYKLASDINKAILVENLDDVKTIDFTNIKEINITSGASTPSYITEAIIEYLKTK